MVQLYATTRVHYGNKDVQPGQPFEASEKDAKLLTKIRKASYAPAVSPTDLPKAAMPASAPEGETMDVAPEPEDSFVEEAAPEATANPHQADDPRTDTRDLVPGQTGQAKPSRSSRLGRRQKGKS